MSQQNEADKTEKASPQKLRKAREQGQVARSRDWAGIVGILVCLQLVVALSPWYLNDFRSLFALAFRTLHGDGVMQNAWSQLFTGTVLLLAKMVLPLLVVALPSGNE